MGQIEKGVIVSLEEKTAKVQSTTADGAETLPLTIPWWLRGEIGNLKKGTEVAYCLFDDATGVILSRMDGEWEGNFFAKTITADSATIDAIAAQDVAAAETVTASGVSLSEHTHSGVMAGGASTQKPER